MISLEHFEYFPKYCVPFNIFLNGGDKPNCMHFFPTSSKIEHDDWVEWKCVHCGASARAEVFD
jgi:hypothetical protein